jgi:hypothetical protein
MATFQINNTKLPGSFSSYVLNEIAHALGQVEAAEGVPCDLKFGRRSSCAPQFASNLAREMNRTPLCVLVQRFCVSIRPKTRSGYGEGHQFTNGRGYASPPPLAGLSKPRARRHGREPSVHMFELQNIVLQDVALCKHNHLACEHHACLFGTSNGRCALWPRPWHTR